MKIRKNYLLPAITGSVVLTAFFSIVFFKSPVIGQDASTSPVQNVSENVNPVERERLVAPTSSSKLSLNSARSAALANRNLKFNLNWNFGKKAQRGWYLYELLIQKQIGTKNRAETAEFAAALAEWQQKEGFLPTGILDKETFTRMVETWQAQRLGKRGGYASEAVLHGAPIADFYDPLRETSLLKVERETYAAYKRMIAAAAKDLSLNLKLTKTGELAPEEPFLKIVSAFRSREHQEKLRRQSPNSGSAGLAVNSPHFTGCALDIYVGGEAVTTKDFNRAVQVQTPVYKWLVKNADRFGFYPYFYEPWHWEYVPQNLR